MICNLWNCASLEGVEVLLAGRAELLHDAVYGIGPAPV
jgi:hypothetical protein